MQHFSFFTERGTVLSSGIGSGTALPELTSRRGNRFRRFGVFLSGRDHGVMKGKQRFLKFQIQTYTNSLEGLKRLPRCFRVEQGRNQGAASRDRGVSDRPEKVRGRGARGNRDHNKARVPVTDEGVHQFGFGRGRGSSFAGRGFREYRADQERAGGTDPRSGGVPPGGQKTGHKGSMKARLAVQDPA